MPVRLAVIGGSGLYGLSFLDAATATPVATPYGAASADVLVGSLGRAHVAFLARHGKDHGIPPHRVNHRANVWALKELGVQRVLGASSVGALRKEIRPGTLAVPHDYLSPWDVPTFYDDRVVHATPALDEGMRNEVIRTAKDARVPVRARAVYAQTRGPRLETKAEVRMLAAFADVVGMTMASEATLAAELGIAYASVCTVDNYANGIAEKPLTYEAIVRTQKENLGTLAGLLEAVVRALVREE